MRDAADVMQFNTFESTDDVDRRVAVPESPRAWPLGTQPMSVAWDDDDVQVRLDDGFWHRQAAGLPETACGLKIDYRKSLGIRPSSYLGKLCTSGCFSQHEIYVIAPAVQALHERDEQAHIDKIVDGAHQTMLDGETRRRKKKDP